MSYYDIYMKRLNRFGTTIQERLQNQRELDFNRYLAKSVYQTSFEYEGERHVCSFEKYRQDETKTLHYLLTHTSLHIPNGTVLNINDDNWMVYYLEEIAASGYNRYIMLHMTHFVTWLDENGVEYNSYAYLFGQENNMLKNELKSRSREDAVYMENLKSSFFIMPITPHLTRDTYLEVGENGLQEHFRVTGYDRVSTEGVMYVTLDPVYKYDLTPAPSPSEEDEAEDFFWLKGGLLSDDT